MLNIDIENFEFEVFLVLIKAIGNVTFAFTKKGT